MKFFESKFDKLEGDEAILEYVCKEMNEVKKIQE